MRNKLTVIKNYYIKNDNKYLFNNNEKNIIDFLLSEIIFFK